MKITVTNGIAQDGKACINIPDTKPGEFVEAELVYMERKGASDWERCVIDGYDPILRTGYEHQQFWIASTPPVKEQPIEKSHPEYACQKCGDRNTIWYAPNEIWNAVNDTDFGILCANCFLEMADQKGLNLIFTCKETNQPPVKEVERSGKTAEEILQEAYKHSNEQNIKLSSENKMLKQALVDISTIAFKTGAVKIIK